VESALAGVLHCGGETRYFLLGSSSEATLKGFPLGTLASC